MSGEKWISRASVALLGLFAAYLLLMVYKTTGQIGDMATHVAEIRAIYDDPFHVRHEVMTGPEADGAALFYTPYHFLWAVVGKTLGISPFATLQLAGVANVFLLIATALYFMGTFVEGPRRYPAAAIFLLICTAFRTVVYAWSSEVALPTLSYALPLPSIFARCVALYLWGAAERHLQGKPIPPAPWLALVFAVVLVTHPVTATWIVVLLVARIALDRRPAPALRILAPIAVGIALAILWPQVSFLNRAVVQPKEFSLYQYSPLDHIWPLYILFCGALGLGYARRYPFFAVGLVATTAIFYLGYLLSIERLSRYLFFMEIFPQALVTLCFVDALKAGALGALQTRLRLALLAGVVISCGFIGPRPPDLLTLVAQPPAASQFRAFSETLAAIIKPNDIVATSEHSIANLVYAATGARAYVGRNVNFIPGGSDRLRLQQLFFRNPTDGGLRDAFFSRSRVTKVIAVANPHSPKLSLQPVFGPPLLHNHAAAPGLSVFAR